MNARANIYHYLAEALLAPPDWICQPGDRWPLFDEALRLIDISPAAREAVARFASISAESGAGRRKRYRMLINGNGIKVPIALHESLYRSGRIAGPETQAVARIYRDNGLDLQGTELPDHASVELAFLAYLTEQDTNPGGSTRREKSFLQAHAGDWLVEVGRQLSRTDDAVYAPIGQFLADWIQEALTSIQHMRPRSYPVILSGERCTMCGFCAQICPTQALLIHEDESQTGLYLNTDRCIGCTKCAGICDPGSLELQVKETDSGQCWQPLVVHKRSTCPRCFQPTVSEAEIEYLSSILGTQAWLYACLDCRTLAVEVPQ